MALPDDDGHDVSDDEWDALRAELGITGVEAPTEQERDALLEAIRRSRS